MDRDGDSFSVSLGGTFFALFFLKYFMDCNELESVIQKKKVFPKKDLLPLWCLIISDDEYVSVELLPGASNWIIPHYAEANASC